MNLKLHRTQSRYILDCRGSCSTWRTGFARIHLATLQLFFFAGSGRVYSFGTRKPDEGFVEIKVGTCSLSLDKC